MSVDTELQNIRNNINSTYNTISTMGGTVPQVQSFENLSSAISTVPLSFTTGPISRFKIVNGTRISLNDINISSAFKDVTSIQGMYNNFYDTDFVGNVNFNNLVSINNDYACFDMFTGAWFLNGSVNFPVLRSITGNYTCSGMFSGCRELKTVYMPFDEIGLGIDGDYACSGMFGGCTGLTSVDMSYLISIDGNYACSGMFSNCSSLKNIDLSHLTNIGNGWCIANMFQGCTSLETISFPSLRNFTESSGFYELNFKMLFSDCTSLTEIHFRADVKTLVESFINYPSKFGASNATIYFDL